MNYQSDTYTSIQSNQISEPINQTESSESYAYIDSENNIFDEQEQIKSDTSAGESLNVERSYYNTEDNLKWQQTEGRGSRVNITYSFSGLDNLDGVSEEEAKTSVREAFRNWSDAAPLNFVELPDGSQDSQIRVVSELLDGSRMGFTEYSYSSNIESVEITFDNSESWTQQGILLMGAHEIGHALGLDHENDVTAIMNTPIDFDEYDTGKSVLSQDDIDGIRSLYGEGTGSVSISSDNPSEPEPESKSDIPREPEPTLDFELEPEAESETEKSDTAFNGTEGDDNLVGDDRPNQLKGFGGDDYLEGGFGYDSINGGEGNDTVSYDYGYYDLSWDMNTDRLSFQAGGSETIRNVENVIGSQGDDRIAGNSAANSIEGGGGADTFIFPSLEGETDIIKDYSIEEGDRIEVNRAGFGSDDKFIYDPNSGGLFYKDTQLAVFENKPSFSSILSGFTVF